VEENLDNFLAKLSLRQGKKKREKDNESRILPIILQLNNRNGTQSGRTKKRECAIPWEKITQKKKKGKRGSGGVTVLMSDHPLTYNMWRTGA